MQEYLTKKVILEIGYGGSPFWVYGRRKVADNEFYIGLDIDLEMIRLGKLLKIKPIPESVADVNADTNFLPFVDSSVDEVVMKEFYSILFLGDPKEIKYELTKVMLEVFRVLKPNGKLIIIETFTPDCSYPYCEKPVEFGFKCLRKSSLLSPKTLLAYSKKNDIDGFCYGIEFFKPQKAL